MLPVATAVPETAVPETAVPVRAAVEVADADVVGAAVELVELVSVGGSAASLFSMLTSRQL